MLHWALEAGMWLVTAAMAQDLPNGDFEVGGLDGWSDDSIVGESLGLDWVEYPYPMASWDPVQARGAGAMLLQYDLVDYHPFVSLLVRSDPYLQTHTALTYAVLRTDPTAHSPEVEIAVPGSPVDIAGIDSLGPPSVDAFEDRVLDATAACGQLVQVRIEGHDEPTWFDDFAQGGAVCPEYTDADLDGLCPRGVDLDGDGVCIGAGEIAGNSVDCDDGTALVGACLVLEQAPALWVRLEEPFTVALTGALPGETVDLYAAASVGTTCLDPSLGDVCLDLGPDLRIIASSVADSGGGVTFAVTQHIGDIDPFQIEHVQALAERLGASVTSDAFEVGIRPASGPPTSIPVNGDIELGSDHFGEVSLDMDYHCVTPVYDADVGRGASLMVESASDTFSTCFTEAQSWPFAVTRMGLAWAQLGSGTVDVRDVNGRDVVTGLPSVTRIAADGFAEKLTDVTSLCGETVYVRMAATGGEHQLWFDDLALDGLPCESYVDPDGDGACPTGADLDGDGYCASDAELPDVPVPDGPTVPIDDMELGIDGFVPTGGTGRQARYADEGFGGPGEYGVYFLPYIPLFRWDMIYARPAALVTHEQLGATWRAEGVGDWATPTWSWDLWGGPEPTSYRHFGEFSDGAGPTLRPDAWTRQELDVSSLCGSYLTKIDLASYDSGADHDGAYIALDGVYFDDLGLSGPVCAIFTDDDGNGLCTQGLDLDGDGTCVDAGEPTPGVAQDPCPELPDGDGDSDGVCAPEDCDDADPLVHPGAPEQCNGLDDDCDSVLPATELDADGDGYPSCADCGPSDPLVYPGAPERCNGLADACATLPADEADDDGDGFVNCADCGPADAAVFPGASERCNGLADACGDLPEDEVDQDGDGVAPCAGDCDDADPAAFPGASERCNGLADGCGGIPLDELDADADGFIDCADCRPTDREAFPGAPERCNGVADGCGDLPDEEVDQDGDGVLPCAGDCDDADPQVFPGAPERCNGVADGCGDLPDDERDADGDGLSACAGDCDDADAGVQSCPKVEESGCACASSGSPGSLAWLASVLWLRRRRDYRLPVTVTRATRPTTSSPCRADDNHRESPCRVSAVGPAGLTGSVAPSQINRSTNPSRSRSSTT